MHANALRTAFHTVWPLTFVSSMALATHAHGGGPAGPVPDAEGDATCVFGGCPDPLSDLASTDVRFDAEAVHFEVVFFTPFDPPSSELPSATGGTLGFDLDQDAGTGIAPPWNPWFPPGFPLGFEYGLNLGFYELENPGFGELRHFETGVVAAIPLTYTEYGFSGSIPLSLLDDDDGVMDFTGGWGLLASPTDASDALGTSYAACAADLDGDRIVAIGDLLIVLGEWGTEGGDVTGDGTTDVSDLLAVLSAWGTCD